MKIEVVRFNLSLFLTPEDAAAGRPQATPVTFIPSLNLASVISTGVIPMRSIPDAATNIQRFRVEEKDPLIENIRDLYEIKMATLREEAALNGAFDFRFTPKKPSSGESGGVAKG